MKLRILALAFLLVVTCLQASPIKLPCKTPQELMVALQTVLENYDTNSFWKLHCWSNVPPTSEKVWKATSLDPFFPGGVKYSAFQIRPVPDEYNKPKKLNRGRTLQPNIPATGMFTYKIKGKSQGVAVDVAVETAFGKGPDGNYWLTVEVALPSTNSPPAAPK